MTDVKTLKSLTQTTFDSAQGYRTAIDKADAPALRSALQRRLTEREQTLAKLNTALTNQGEKPIDSGSMSGKAHQLFTGIADAFDSGDEAAVERVEEGEDYIAGKFRDALKDDIAQTDPVRPVIEDAYREIREGERFTDMLEKQYS